MATVEDEEYYHGLLPRDDVAGLLKNPGDYLIRVGEQKGSEPKHLILSLCVQIQGEPPMSKHFKVEMVNNKYTFDNTVWGDTVVQLLEAYKTPGKSLSTEYEAVLRTPISRASWELLHENIVVGQILGEGTFGSVNKGELSLPGRRTMTVALKCAKTEESNKENICEMMKEARLMRNFDHPNVVKIYGVAVEKEPLLIVMEYVSGGDLRSFLQKKKTTKTEKLKLICNAAWGVEYLHKKLCIHRDLAARNCLLGKNQQLKISDFGLSREGAAYTIHTVRMIPIRWQAPEIFKTGTFTPRSDVWSFGVLMWEVYADGEEPYKGKSNSEVKTMLTNGIKNPIPKDTPSEVADVMEKHCWSMDPELRPLMNEIVHMLDKVSGLQAPNVELPTTTTTRKVVKSLKDKMSRRKGASKRK